MTQLTQSNSYNNLSFLTTHNVLVIERQWVTSDWFWIINLLSFRALQPIFVYQPTPVKTMVLVWVPTRTRFGANANPDSLETFVNLKTCALTMANYAWTVPIVQLTGPLMDSLANVHQDTLEVIARWVLMNKPFNIEFWQYITVV